MKLQLPDYGFTYDATPEGVKAMGQIFESETDKQLYLAILNNLQIDFKNAPVYISDGNPVMQRILYMMQVNKFLKITTDEDVNIKQNVEAMNATQLRKMSRANPIFGTYTETTDLQ